MAISGKPTISDTKAESFTVTKKNSKMSRTLQLVAVVQGRLDQEREDRLGEVESDDEDREEAQQRIDQPFAQLDQVIEQRHRLVVFGSVVRLGQGKVVSVRRGLCRPLAGNSKR